MNEEIWKDIPGYEGMYQVSNLGRVKSLTRRVKTHNSSWTVNGRILKLQNVPSVSKYKTNTYQRVTLSGRSIEIHRLIAITFIPNPENKPCVNHIDGNGANNNVLNLEWCTYKENVLHSFHVLGNKFKTGEDHHSSKPVIQYKNNIEIARFASATDAGKSIGSGTSSVADVCRGVRGSCKGFVFKYF